MAKELDVQQSGLSAKDVIDLVKAAITEFRKPTEEEQAKKDADALRMKQRQDASIEAAKMEAAQKEANWARCSHMKPHPYVGKLRVVAPKHADGLFHPICLNCQKEFLPFPPGPNTIREGTTLDDYSGVSIELIERFGKEHAAKQKAAG